MTDSTIGNSTDMPLGFGCVKLTSCTNEREALKTLDTAYQNGIKHFDVARVYGLGKAERILGKFALDKRSELTITTKFGINPPKKSFLFANQQVLNIAKKAIKSLPFLYKKIVNQTAGFMEYSPFDSAEAKLSIETSLKELRTDYIDYLLLHEYSLEKANSTEVIDFLKALQKEGKILHFGIGTHLTNLTHNFQDISPEYKLIQFDSHFLNDNISQVKHTTLPSQKLVIHSIFSAIQILPQKIAHHPVMGKRLKDILNVTNISTTTLIAFALADAVYANKNGITLFSSTNSENIKNNIRYLQSPAFSIQQVNDAKKLLQSL